MASTKVKEEKQHHREAFEIYYVMGDTRSIRRVAKEMGKAPSTVQSWADSFSWKERCEIRDAQVQKQFTEMQKKTNDTLVEIKANYHKFLKALIAEAIESMKLKKLKITSIHELIRVMEMDLTLLGEEDRKAQGQLNDLTTAIQASLSMFGSQGQPAFVYDGKDRIDGESNESDD